MKKGYIFLSFSLIIFSSEAFAKSRKIASPDPCVSVTQEGFAKLLKSQFPSKDIDSDHIRVTVDQVGTAYETQVTLGSHKFDCYAKTTMSARMAPVRLRQGTA